MIKSDFPTDQQSIVSQNRKSSRLSNFNPMRGRGSIAIPRPIPTENKQNPHLQQYTQLSPPLKSPTMSGGFGMGANNESTNLFANQLSPQNTNNSLHQIHSHQPPHIVNFNPDHISQQQQQQQRPLYNSLKQHYQYDSGTSPTPDDNYRLVRMDTNRSVTSDCSTQSQYRVSLIMNKKEIELIRYTWNIMLLDERMPEPSSSLPIPGGFGNTGNVGKEKSIVYMSRTSASTVASSLFCRQFYGNLLSMDPSLEKLFPSIKHQAVSFAGVLSFAISQLENLSNLDDYLVKLGKRHARVLNIEPAQFELMGEALIETFYERFGAKFSRELEILWIKLYLYLANSILQFGIDPVFRYDDGRQHSRQQGDNVYDDVFTRNSGSSLSDSGSTLLNNNMSMQDRATNSTISTFSNGELYDKRTSFGASNLATTYENHPLPPTPQSASLMNDSVVPRRKAPVSSSQQSIASSRSGDVFKKKKRECVIM